MCRAVLLSVAVLSLGFAPAPFLKSAAEADPKALQGVWTIKSWSMGGFEPITLRGHDETTVEGNRWSISSEGKVTSRGTIALDLTKHPSRMIRDAVEDGKRERTLLIYKLDGDTLITFSMCGGKEWSRVYPKELKPGPGIMTVVYSRKKP